MTKAQIQIMRNMQKAISIYWHMTIDGRVNDQVERRMAEGGLPKGFAIDFGDMVDELERRISTCAECREAALDASGWCNREGRYVAPNNNACKWFIVSNAGGQH